MNKLEQYLDNNNILYTSDINDYEKFGYDNYPLFKLHLNFLLENCYDIEIKENKHHRLNQQQFRHELLKKYNSKCIITNEDCIDELEACHIIPVSDNESYELNNGLLLRSNIHKTFDKFLWSINPDTLIIEGKNDIKLGNIKKYIGKKINLDFEV